MVTGAMALSLAVGCKNDPPKPAEKPTAPAVATPAAAPSAQGKSGKVLETMNAGGYTYVNVDTGTEKIWAAAPEFKVKVGDAVIIPQGAAMPNYHSKSLNRDFDMVYFVDTVMVGGASAAQANPQMPADHPNINERAKAPAVEVKLTGIKKAEGGQTVVEVFSNKKQLVGKEVKVRGKVVKFSPEIMGKNWIHLQDGSGAAGTNDLTVTTKVTAKVGDTVLVIGKVVADKDFGYGYKYDVILEDAKVTVE